MDASPPTTFWFRHPCNIFIVGPTGSGKTQFMKSALSLNQFDPAPQRLIWIYAEWQEAYERLQQLAVSDRLGRVRKIEFVKDSTDYDEIYETLNPKTANMLVIDDQMTEAKKNADHLANLFVKGSHHRNVTVVLMLQNMFEKGMRTASLNTQYMVLLKNPRDRSQIGKLADQLMPNNRRFLVDVYEDATARPHSHLILDFKQDTPEELRFVASAQDKVTHVYVPTDYVLSDQSSS